MRYKPDQKARAREALVQAGARSLKSAGFNGIGVDGLAASAGVTSGAFYSNFPNKEAMLEAVIDDLSTSPEARHVGFSAADLRTTWQTMIDTRDEVLTLFR